VFSSRNITSKVTRDQVLEIVSEEEIFRRYLNVEVQFDYRFCSPLREDKNPTCGFKDMGSMILLKDFSGKFSGDCFKAVSTILNISYSQAIQRVATDYNMISCGMFIPYPKKPELVERVNRQKIEKVKKIIQVKRQAWTTADKTYWKQFGLNSKILNHFNVASCSHIWLDEKLAYTYNVNNPAYVYYFGDGDYKIYFPRAKELGRQKFWGNGNNIQGLSQLDLNQKIVIITKSLKDVMVLHSLGITSVAPPQESSLVPSDLIETLKTKFEHVFILYDNDEVGTYWSKLNAEKYKLNHIELDCLQKDLSDFRIENDQETTKQFLYYHLDNAINYANR